MAQLSIITRMLSFSNRHHGMRSVSFLRLGHNPITESERKETGHAQSPHLYFTVQLPTRYISDRRPISLYLISNILNIRYYRTYYLRSEISTDCEMKYT